MLSLLFSCHIDCLCLFLLVVLFLLLFLFSWYSFKVVHPFCLIFFHIFWGAVPSYFLDHALCARLKLHYFLHLIFLLFSGSFLFILFSVTSSLLCKYLFSRSSIAPSSVSDTFFSFCFFARFFSTDFFFSSFLWHLSTSLSNCLSSFIFSTSLSFFLSFWIFLFPVFILTSFFSRFFNLY